MKDHVQLQKINNIIEYLIMISSYNQENCAPTRIGGKLNDAYLIIFRHQSAEIILVTNGSIV